MAYKIKNKVDTGFGEPVWSIEEAKKLKEKSFAVKEEKEKSPKTFSTFRQLNNEVEKRDYDNILGLKAEISAKDYDNFLGALPPMKWEQGEKESHFYLSEFLTGNLTYKFTQKEINGKTKYYAEVVDFKKEAEDREYYRERYGVEKEDMRMGE